MPRDFRTLEIVSDRLYQPALNRELRLQDFEIYLRRASPDRAGMASTSNQRVGMRAPKSWALELPMAAPGYWKGNRAGRGAALPTSVTSNADKVWVVYLQA